MAQSASAHTDLITVHADLSSRSATTITSGLDGTTLYPGVWTCTGYYTLGFGSTFTLDAQNNPNAVFILINSGYLHVSSGGTMLLVNGAQVWRYERRRLIVIFERTLMQASNVFWALGAYAALDAGSTTVRCRV